MCRAKAGLQNQNKEVLSFEEIRKALYGSIQQVYEHDFDLIESHVSELDISAQLSHHLKNDAALDGFQIDTEYNKMKLENSSIEEPKVINASAFDKRRQKIAYLQARPDIAIHRRHTQTRNFLWVEVKMAWGDSPNEDITKIKKVTVPYDSKAKYVTGYSYGISIVLGETSGTCTWIMNNNSKIGRAQCFSVDATRNGDRHITWEDEYEVDIESY